MLSDTDEYPSYHSFFGYSYSGESTRQIAEAIEKLPEKKACSLRGVIDFFLLELSGSSDEVCDASSDSGDQQLDDELLFALEAEEEISALMEPGISSNSRLHLSYLKR